MMILAFAALALAMFSLPLLRLNVAQGIPVLSLLFATLALLGAFFAAILSLPTLLLSVVGASLAGDSVSKWVIWRSPFCRWLGLCAGRYPCQHRLWLGLSAQRPA